MKTMRFYPVFLLAVFALVSCKKDDNDEPVPSAFTTITASNVQVDPGTPIDEVWLRAFSIGSGYEPIAKVPFQNNGFSITLPTDVADKYMVPANDWWIPEVDPSIKIAAYIELSAVYQGNVIGSFSLRDASFDTTVSYMFATAPFTVTGSFLEYGYVYHMNLKAGWNQYAITNWGGNPEDYTSTIPSGLTWRFSHL